MREVELLHKFLSKSLPNMHKTRINSLICGVENALNGSKLTLTGLGRACLDNTQVKNKIKRMDRLLGNNKLYTEINDIYSAIAHMLIGNKKHPIIIIDWASVDNRDKFHVLKASIAYEGRAITILDQIELQDRSNKKRTKKKKGERNSHDVFIETLAKILPQNCQPILVADAAFSASWYKRIEAINWYWVGRLRGKVKIKDPVLADENKENWLPCSQFWHLATKTPKSLGEHTIAKQNPFDCNLFIYKKPKVGRVRKNKDGSIKKRNKDHDYEKSAREPWLLATNLPKRHTLAKKVVEIYSQRMQIEEIFRDTKSPHYGLGIRLTLSNKKERVAVLMLISSLALLILGALGKAAYELKLHVKFQANTIKHRKVLSLWYLGHQILKHMKNKIPIEAFRTAFTNFLNGMQCYEML
jgi:hypothetical protein